MFVQHQTLSARTQPDSKVVARDTLSLADYAARRSYAFDEAEAAFWSGALCADSYMLFRLLTRLCKERTYCWPGLDYLAGRLHTSIGTIKRRLDRLERAGLIERQQRPGGLTSYTYIVPLQHYDTAGPVTAHEQHALPQPSDMQVAQPPHAQPLFFVPEEEISAGPPNRSTVISHTIKNQNLNPGGGRKQVEPAEDSDPVVALLTEGGVLSAQVLAELKHTPLADAAACLQFAQQQPHILDPAAFAVALIRQGLGSKLAQRPKRRQRDRLGAARPISVDDPDCYQAYHCDHGHIRGCCAACAVPAAGQRPPYAPQTADTEAVCGARAAAADGESQVWSDVLAHLEQRLRPAEFSAWLNDTALLRLDDNHAVIGTPNVFVHERLASDYDPLIAAALEMRLGRRLVIEYAIGLA